MADGQAVVGRFSGARAARAAPEAPPRRAECGLLLQRFEARNVAAPLFCNPQRSARP